MERKRDAGVNGLQKLQKKIEAVVAVDEAHGGVRVSLAKGFRRFKVFPAELDFIGADLPAGFLKQVKFLLLVGAPEIIIFPPAVIGVVFNSFGDDKVFKQAAFVGAQRERIEVVNERVADTGVIKINFPVFFKLIAQVTAERRKVKYHKGLLQDVDVICRGFLVNADGLPKFGVGNFLADLQGQCLQEFEQDIMIADAGIGENVFIKIAVGQVREDIGGVADNHFGVHAQDNAFFQGPGKLDRREQRRGFSQAERI